RERLGAFEGTADTLCFVLRPLVRDHRDEATLDDELDDQIGSLGLAQTNVEVGAVLEAQPRTGLRPLWVESGGEGIVEHQRARQRWIAGLRLYVRRPVRLEQHASPGVQQVTPALC